jgi:hypothetical protein
MLSNSSFTMSACSYFLNLVKSTNPTGALDKLYKDRMMSELTECKNVQVGGRSLALRPKDDKNCSQLIMYFISRELNPKTKQYNHLHIKRWETNRYNYDGRVESSNSETSVFLEEEK